MSIENDSLSSKIGYLYYIIENRVCWGEKPGFGGSKSVGSYGFSSRRITGGHALILSSIQREEGNDDRTTMTKRINNIFRDRLTESNPLGGDALLPFS